MHVIVGAGPVGSATALLLAERGEQVRIVTRSGHRPAAHPASSGSPPTPPTRTRLTELTEGAAALYNCANPAYHRWLDRLAAARRGAAARRRDAPARCWSP